MKHSLSFFGSHGRFFRPFVPAMGAGKPFAFDGLGNPLVEPIDAKMALSASLHPRAPRHPRSGTILSLIIHSP